MRIFLLSTGRVILPCSGETPPAMQHPALGSPTQKRHKLVGVNPEEATKMIGGVEERLREFELFSLEKRNFTVI